MLCTVNMHSTLPFTKKSSSKRKNTVVIYKHAFPLILMWKVAGFHENRFWLGNDLVVCVIRFSLFARGVMHGKAIVWGCIPEALLESDFNIVQ